MNDPERRNALGAAMFDALEGVLAEVEGDAGVVVVLLRGAGGAFSAGFDLTAAVDEPALLKSFILRLSGVCRRLRRMRPVVIACVDGPAIAGGCAMLSACDLAVAAPDAKIGYPVHRLGISPAVSAPTLVQAIGAGAARHLQLGGALISGVEAHRCGLVSHLAASRETTLQETRELAERVAGHGAHALAATKAWLNELDGSLDDDRFDRVAADTADEAVQDEAVALMRAAWTKR